MVDPAPMASSDLRSVGTTLEKTQFGEQHLSKVRDKFKRETNISLSSFFLFLLYFFKYSNKNNNYTYIFYTYMHMISITF